MAQTQSFGELLRERRTAKAESDPAFSLRQLANRVGIEPSYLSKIERGEQPPRSASWRSENAGSLSAFARRRSRRSSPND